MYYYRVRGTEKNNVPLGLVICFSIISHVEIIRIYTCIKAKQVKYIFNNYLYGNNNEHVSSHEHALEHQRIRIRIN